MAELCSIRLRGGCDYCHRYCRGTVFIISFNCATSNTAPVGHWHGYCAKPASSYSSCGRVRHLNCRCSDHSSILSTFWNNARNTCFRAICCSSRTCCSGLLLYRAFTHKCAKRKRAVPRFPTKRCACTISRVSYVYPRLRTMQANTTKIVSGLWYPRCDCDAALSIFRQWDCTTSPL